MANIILSAQNVDIYEGDGLDPCARTGSISSEHLIRAGAEGVILGHSEVSDSIEVVNKKLLTLASHQASLAKSTLLIGDTWDDFEGHSAEEVAELTTRKLGQVLINVATEFIKTLVIGYEPKWGSRGSGRDDMPPPSAHHISVCIAAMKYWLAKRYGDIAETIPLIYGGRSTPERSEEILRDENVSGLILGSACDSLTKTMDIAKAMKIAKPHGTKVIHANFKAYKLKNSYEEYVSKLKSLDDDFIVYISPPYTDIFKVHGIFSNSIR